MTRVVPKVNQVAEFFEIMSDFRDPRDAIREAISNAFDADANGITVELRMDTFKGEEELVLEMSDDGEGMVPSSADEHVPSLEAFFGLGYSPRRETLAAIGKKGHGTKTYFNTRRIEVWTWRGDQETYALMEEPRNFLAEKQVPPYDYETKSAPKGHKTGTKVLLSGYARNETKGFSHNELRDFIFWFTKFGSVEMEIGHQERANKTLRLRGLDRTVWEDLSFGHKFAKEDFDLRRLKRKDPASPTKYFVKKWLGKALPLKGFPHKNIDIVFYIEGDNAKDYNPMLRRQGRPRKAGMYSVEDRYGLWVCKDYIPIQPMNEWVAKGQRVSTKYHAFVNCQAFRLTANRGDVGNTPEAVLNAIRETTIEWFENTVITDKVYKQYQEEIETETTYREPKQEEQEFKKRKRIALAKRVCKINNKKLFKRATIELMEPRQEVGVLALFYMLYSLNPALFKFSIVDYDTKRGYDALVRVKYGHEISKESLRFVEFKKTLEKEFSHSFPRLGGIVCWTCNLGNNDVVKDIAGETRQLKITKPKKKRGYTKYMLTSETEEHNIEVYVLKDYLRERCKVEFRPRTST